MLPAATLAVIIASLIVGVGLIATARGMNSRQNKDSLFLAGLAFIALGVLVAFVQSLLSGGST